MEGVVVQSPGKMVITLQFRCGWMALLTVLVAVGCGTTREHRASDQLLLSDAVDRTVARIDFSPLADSKLYLDTQYVQPVEDYGFVNADYVIASLRQQIVAAGCLLQENREDADLILEARLGALGKDGHDVSYGLPANNALSNAAQLLPNAPPLPPLPELSLGKRRQDLAAAKISVFAYDAETKHPVWQSGTSVAHSTAKYRWVLGAGPFQSGSIYDGGMFAGNRWKKLPRDEPEDAPAKPEDAFRQTRVWSQHLSRSKSVAKQEQPESDIELAAHEAAADE